MKELKLTEIRELKRRLIVNYPEFDWIVYHLDSLMTRIELVDASNPSLGHIIFKLYNSGAYRIQEVKFVDTAKGNEIKKFILCLLNA